MSALCSWPSSPTGWASRGRHLQSLRTQPDLFGGVVARGLQLSEMGTRVGCRRIVEAEADPRNAMAIEVLSAVGRWDHFASLLAKSGCVCMAYRNSSLDTLSRLEHMRNLCEREPGPGVLASVDGEVAAWCSVAPKCT
jgi:hypothetical protein